MVPELRYLVVRGRSTSLRFALPALGSISIGSGAGNDLRIREPDVAREHAILFLDHGIGLRALDAKSALAERGSAPDGPRREKAIGAGQTVELELGDRVRLGSIELAFFGGVEAEPRVHVLARAHGERRLRAEVEAASADGRSVTVLRLRVPHAKPEVIEAALGRHLGDARFVAELGPSEWLAVLASSSELAAQQVASELARTLAASGAELFAGSASSSEADVGELVELAGDRLARPSSAAQRGKLLPSKDRAMQEIERLVDRVARASTHVLVLGETGVGKDLVAQAIHERSSRASGPFIRVNCVDLSDSFLEEAATNFLSRARGGTVHLDEVAGLSLRAQLSLGYLLDESPSTGHDVRFLASSNQDLSAHVASGAFRKDLFFRLNQVTIAVPPLRSRLADVGPLAELFLARAAESHGRAKAPRLTDDAKRRLEAYAWPGNVRELKNVVERALLLAPSDVIGPEHLPPELVDSSAEITAPEADDTDDVGPAVRAVSATGKPGSLREEIAALEKKRIVEALAKYPTQRDAAAALDMPMRTFLNRLDALGIPRARGGGQKGGASGSGGAD
ncbi:sigma 54-interacting transcriptional regulator [Myxococcota bacterium]|nr:sigma 54-interacting transcriptional regulator [Myxococcota bacterium]